MFTNVNQCTDVRETKYVLKRITLPGKVELIPFSAALQLHYTDFHKQVKNTLVRVLICT